MNKVRRKMLADIEEKIISLQGDLESLLCEEEEYRDNMPENLQNSERYDAAENACENISNAIDSLEEAVSYIEDAQE